MKSRAHHRMQSSKPVLQSVLCFFNVLHDTAWRVSAVQRAALYASYNHLVLALRGGPSTAGIRRQESG